MNQHFDIPADHVDSTRLSGEQNHRCAYCQFTMLLAIETSDVPRHPRRATKDHVESKSQGGSDNWDNLVAACNFCNSLKDNTHPYLFLMFIQLVLKRPYLRTFWENGTYTVGPKIRTLHKRFIRKNKFRLVQMHAGQK